MEQRKLTELEVSEKLCDIACKIQQVVFMYAATNAKFAEKYPPTKNAFEAIKQNLISLIKEVGFDNLTYFQQMTARNCYKELKTVTIDRAFKNSPEEQKVCEQLGKEI